MTRGRLAPQRVGFMVQLRATAASLAACGSATLYITAGTQRFSHYGRQEKPIQVFARTVFRMHACLRVRHGFKPRRVFVVCVKEKRRRREKKRSNGGSLFPALRI